MPAGVRHSEVPHVKAANMLVLHRLVTVGNKPIKADTSAFGTLPTEAYRYCEPVRNASSFGIYVFLPYDLSMIMENGNVYWSLDHFQNRYLLHDAVQYPGFSSVFDNAAPESCRSYSPPFLTRTNTDNIVQIWSGHIAETDDGIASLVRSPTNIHFNPAYEIIEGMIDTDWWFGPLFTNIRIWREDTPILISKNKPFIQIVPLERSFVRKVLKEDVRVTDGLAEMTAEQWGKFNKTVPMRMGEKAKLGDYARKSRRLEG